MRIASLLEFDRSAKVGDWCFLHDDTYIAIRLHEGEMDGYAVIPISTNDTLPAAWRWNGSHDAPTLEPSILHHSNPPWHGWLRDGKLVLA